MFLKKLGTLGQLLNLQKKDIVTVQDRRNNFFETVF